MRVLHQRIAALLSAALVVFSGNIAHGEKIMSSKNTRSTHKVYTSKAGRRYARTLDVIYSAPARDEISRQVRLSGKSANGKNGSRSVKTTARDK
jgi:hypothetical protein